MIFKPKSIHMLVTQVYILVYTLYFVKLFDHTLIENHITMYTFETGLDIKFAHQFQYQLKKNTSL